MGQEHRLNTTSIDTEASQVARPICAGVNHLEVRSSLNGQARSGTLVVDQQATRSAEQDMNPVRSVRQSVKHLASGQGPLQHTQRDLLWKQRKNSRSNKANQTSKRAADLAQD